METKQPQVFVVKVQLKMLNNISWMEEEDEDVKVSTKPRLFPAKWKASQVNKNQANAFLGKDWVTFTICSLNYDSFNLQDHYIIPQEYKLQDISQCHFDTKLQS